MSSKSTQILCIACVALAASIATAPSDAATSMMVVQATVQSATYLNPTGCNVGSATSFGTLLPGTQATTAPCVIKFGSSNDTSSLHISQEDRIGEAMQPGPASPVDPGLVAFWAMNDSDADLSSTGNNLTLAALPDEPTYSIARPGWGSMMTFDGTDVASAPHVAAYALDTFTVELWIKFAPGFGASTGIAGIDSGNSNENFQIFTRSTGILSTDISSNGGAVGDLNSGIAVNDGLWHHIGLVVDSTPVGPNKTEKVYVDGVLRGTRFFSGDVDNPALPLKIGDFGELSGFNKVTGSIDEFRMYNRALTSDEVQRRASATLNPGVLHDYGSGGDWTAQSQMFGVCLASLTGTGASTPWVIGGACPTVDGVEWAPVPALPTDPGGLAAQLASSAEDGVASFVFGISTSDTQPPGTYVSRIEFDVNAP